MKVRKDDPSSSGRNPVGMKVRKDDPSSAGRNFYIPTHHWNEVFEYHTQASTCSVLRKSSQKALLIPILLQERRLMVYHKDSGSLPH
ncbi:hypothetical protein CDAR_562551 [Caerostris darwini]|uniref:Uncharacterized protein n=1 Tax=Caerostris darwini TaxID=1538125 RepID=A0AAV4X6Q7_9ARAC|nr:hypothetical protein CDAR_562551 [Caerostris darwini]